MVPPVKDHPVLCVALTPALQQIRELDHLVTGEVNRCRQVTYAAAGKGLNVARVVHQLGLETEVAGFVGGAVGVMLCSALDADGVAHRFVSVDANTRICDTLIDAGTGRVTELVAESILPGPAAWEAFHIQFREQVGRAGLLVLAGAPMPGAPDKLYADMVQSVSESCPVLIDAREAPLLEALLHAPLLAKLNAEELAWTVGHAVDHVDTLCAAGRDLINRGAQFVLVTRGEQGAVLLGADCEIHFTPPSMPVLNPIGSGDAMTAGIAVGLQRGASMVEAVRLGMACGAANVTTLRPADVDPGQVEELIPRVGVRTVPC